MKKQVIKKSRQLVSIFLMSLIMIGLFSYAHSTRSIAQNDYFEAAYAIEKSESTDSDHEASAAISNYYENKFSSLMDEYILLGENVNETAFANKNSISYENPVVVSRGLVSRTTRGEALDWWSEVRGKLVKRDDVLLIKDYETGRTFKLAVEGGTNHADVEPLTKSDANIIKQLWGGNYSWDRRPVLVFTKTKVIAASMNGMPHAGVDGKQYRAVVSNRSCGYGRGINYDMVKGNGVDGHFCLHFKNSTLHKNGKVDYRHQQAVKTASAR